MNLKFWQRGEHANVFWTGTTKGKPVINPQSSVYSETYGHTPEIEMAKLLKTYRSCTLLGSSVKTHVKLSVGHGFYITADTSTAKGKKAKALIERIAREINLDALNEEISQSMWITGNAFVTKPIIDKRKKSIKGLKVIPFDSMIGIREDQDGKLLGYTQQVIGGVSNPGGLRDIATDQLLHFSINNENGDRWGTGLGQVMSREGEGYVTVNDTKLQRPSLASLLEMLEDMSGKMVYGGVPRYVIFVKKGGKIVVEDLTKQFDGMDPLQHVITNADATVETISLDTQNKFDAFISHIMKMAVMALQDPTIQLWTSMSFTYASSESAMEAMMPGIAAYEREHKKFLEAHVFKPIIDAYMGPKAWDEVDLQLNWGEPDAMDIEAILNYVAVFTNPLMADHFNWRDVGDMLKNAGYDANLLAQDDKGKEGKPKTDLKSKLDPEGMQATLAKMAADKRAKEKHDLDIRAKKAQIAMYEAIANRGGPPLAD